MEKTILVLDDSPFTLRMVSDLLTSWSYAVTPVRDGRTACEKLKSGNYDLIVTDLNMPGMDGIEFAREVRALPGCRFLPIVMFSGEKNAERIAQAKKEGVSTFLSKPLKEAQLANNGSSRNIFVRSPADEDWDAIETTCRRWMARPYSPAKGEWQYLKIPPRLLVEPLLPGPDGQDIDNYRLWCFDGAVNYVQLSTQRDGAWHTAFYHPDWTRAPFAYVWPIDPLSRPPPPSLAAMLDGAAKLAAGLPFARVDLYDVDGRPRFGEITLTPSAGFGRFSPPQADAELGRLWPQGGSTRR